MTTFSELPLSSALQQKLAAAQFTNLTPIQEGAIPPALEGRDVIGTAQTGTGKTLAFLIPLIETLQREPANHTTALVLLPTRELAMQVHEQYEQLRTRRHAESCARHRRRVGERPDSEPARWLGTGDCHSRTLAGSHESQICRPAARDILVLDEADRMLDMGFLPAIRRILAVLPAKRQTLCFSATMEQSVAGLVTSTCAIPYGLLWVRC